MAERTGAVAPGGASVEPGEGGIAESELRLLLEGLTAVRDGDFRTRLPDAAEGLLGEIATVFNGMVNQLSQFTSEVTRVAREVGTEGTLGGQAEVPGVGGAWLDLTDSVNFMAGNLTDQVRNIAQVTTAVAQGDLSQKITVDARGEILELKNTINTMVDQLSSFAGEVTRMAREVGTEGLLGGQADVKGVSGTWRDLTDSVNFMAGNLTAQVRSIAQVATAVAQGDLSQKITVTARGEILELKTTINTMVDQLSGFADEVTRVAREVGTEGNLGGQATVRGVSGTWKDLTDNVNVMASNLTGQVRSIAQVATAVARGDLSQKITVEAKGEVAVLAGVINTMVDTLSAFADEVTRVAREVGTEGRLGGQARVPNVAGTWKGLTENVNELAGNLTRQVRAIAAVTSAVAEGDLTRSITVEAPGEVGDLKDNINSMVGSLRETTRANQEQDWLKSNLARISGLMQGHRDLAVVAELVMDELTPLVAAQYGAFYLAEDTPDGTVLTLVGSYGRSAADGVAVRFALGESLVGQAARSHRTITTDQVPAGYVISSGLGHTAPGSLMILPIVVDDQVLGVIELASFSAFTPVHRDFLGQLLETIGVNVNTIVANARTDELLGESQRLTAELQARSAELQDQQEELQRSNAELEEKAALLASQNRDIEAKNLQIEHARQELEDRAQQLSLASKYKSEFLANMSHELRTPLNSLLILAQLLAQNPTRNLTAKQVEYAGIIHSAGSDLLQLINDILDLSKVEAGKMDIHPERVHLPQLLDYVEATFRPMTTQKSLDFTVTTAPDAPADLLTDDSRLRQVLRNLLSNAVKFTERGGVELRIERATDAEVPARLLRRGSVMAFRVRDTGIGIPEQQLESVFGAFQQADGTTSRKYGGTGLGLSITREIAQLLGGAVAAESTPGQGSTFTLYLPVSHAEFEDGPALQTTSPVLDPAPARRGLPDQRREGESGTPGGRQRQARRLLVIEERQGGLLSLVAASAERELVPLPASGQEHGGVQVVGATSSREAAAVLASEPFHCVVLELDMPGGEALRFLDALDGDPALSTLPVLAHSNPRLGHGREDALRERAGSHRVELLSSLDELRERIVLHLSADRPGEPGPHAGAPAHSAGESTAPDGDLAGRTVLVVDDDARNLFALSGILELHGVRVLHAEDGRKGIEALTRNSGIDLILMDVMMPELDGYAATEEIRRMPAHAGLPIIAVTAKAMPGDREKSLAAGASDYVTKPVDADDLIGRVRHWLTEPGRRDAGQAAR
ncbi:HAMP domain-containing protein [Streptomyces sp. NBC_00158]|uniref:HAMP domain-containing protein n=1 Tax=Streptomyces sp. NBC_00158 TaxID=2903627 RepID=UPI003250C251